MKYITVKLTEDQQRFLGTLIDDYVLYNPVRQTPARRAFATRVQRALHNRPQEVDHSEAQNIINAKLAKGGLKLSNAKS
jgi:hypothetical protein